MGPKESELRRRHARDPRDMATLIALIALMRRQGRSSEVAWLLHLAISHDPGNGELMRQMGNTLLEGGAVNEAIRYYEAAVRAPRVDGRTITNLAVCYRGTGKRKASRDLLMSVKDDTKLPPRGLALKAIEAHLAGNATAARRLAEQALERSKNDPIMRCVVDSLGAVSRRRPGRSVPKVVLHLNQAFHYSILKPVFEAMVQDFDVLITEDLAWIQEHDPRVIIAADAQARMLRPLMPKVRFVFTRHGLIDKGNMFATAREYDYVCASSEGVHDHYVRVGGFEPDRVWVTGYSQMDPLFRPEPLPLPFAVSADRPLVVFAPTYNRGLSGVEMLKAEFAEKILGSDDAMSLVVKPHPLTVQRNPRWMRWFRDAAARRKNVHVDEDPASNIIPFLKRADLLVSDASSVVFQYLAVDRPVVLLDNPDRFNDPRFESEAVEWRWREFAERVDDPANLVAAVKRGLAEPGSRASERQRRAAELFGTLRDGRAGERIAHRVADVIARS